LDSATSTSPKKRSNVRHSRSFSASEIARNAKRFDIWCSFQGCEEVEFSDLPEDYKVYVGDIFNTRGRLPAEWVDKSSKFYRRMKATSSAEFVAFLMRVNEEYPQLFSNTSSAERNRRLLDEMKSVFFVWERLQRMRSESNDKVSEAEFVSNVYESLRSSALCNSTYKVKLPIGLPQPPPHPQIRTETARILNPKSAVPDSAVFVPEKDIRKLSLAADSAFKQLRRSRLTGSAARGEESFTCQSTPCVQLSRTPGFRFVSSFWEDKKPGHSLLEDAYRQNRMSTAAAVRHLQSLHIKAPVIGLIWSDGRVRAHVDWCASEGQEPLVCTMVRSALFPGLHRDGSGGNVHEWQLDSPSDMIEVFLLIKNIDHWTVNGFLECIERGIADLVDSVLTKGHPYQPWKRVGTLKASRTKEAPAAENSSSQPSAPPPVRRSRRRRSRPS
ncbi:hypothetical protein BGW80DRAFT_1161831, partial [Lactifluus volemus]